MIKVVRPSLSTKEKSVELKLFHEISTLHTIVCSYTRSIALDVRPVRQQRYTVKFFQLLWCCCYFSIFLMLLLTLNILYLLLMSSMLPSGIFLWTTNQCFIYLSSGKTLVGNCANDWPYREHSEILVYISCYDDVIFTFLLLYCSSHWENQWDLAIVFFTSCFTSLLTWSKFFIMFLEKTVLIFTIETVF